MVIPKIVEENRRCRRGSDGYDGCRGVVGYEIWGGEVEAGLWGWGSDVPEAESIIKGAGKEGIVLGTEREGCDERGVAFKVAQELVVVGGEVADRVVFFGGGIENRLRVMGEASQVGAVLLGKEGFDELPFFCIVDLKGVVSAGGEKEFARVVEVERGY